jgi:threonine dehydrogenase-like Zn-dependent dehydrogenase
MFKECKLTAAYGNTPEENRQCLRWMPWGKVDARPLITDTITLDRLLQVYKEGIHTGKTIKVLVRIGG